MEEGNTSWEACSTGMRGCLTSTTLSPAANAETCMPSHPASGWIILIHYG